MQLTQTELARWLRQAEVAHAEYEKSLGHRDENWPEWYADFILKQMEE